ncbi:MAG: HEAT repeat domain-containing protein [Leadbetterella sp.]|nr:HEAT repeat domain-containing protein [Leadbetterella sp.]
MEKIIDYINGELPEHEKRAFEERLALDPELRAACEEEKALWNLMAEIKAPAVNEHIKSRFLDTLQVYKEAAAPRPGFLSRLKEIWNFQPQLKLSYALVLLCVGLGTGLYLNRKNHGEIARMSAEVSEMKQMMVLSLIENPSATERIRAVSMTQEIRNVDDTVIEALLSTLNRDPNDNVRLMTLEALTELADNPKVREGLVQSIVLQTSPIMQSAMADVMLKLQEKRSVKPLQKMLNRDDLNSTVKDKVEQTIQEILI